MKATATIIKNPYQHSRKTWSRAVKIGQGCFLLDNKDTPTAQPGAIVTVEYDPEDQFAKIVPAAAAPSAATITIWSVHSEDTSGGADIEMFTTREAEQEHINKLIRESGCKKAIALLDKGDEESVSDAWFEFLNGSGADERYFRHETDVELPIERMPMEERAKDALLDLLTNIEDQSVDGQVIPVEEFARDTIDRLREWLCAYYKVGGGE